MTTGIYRTTEDGNQRVLEDSVGLRVTENYVEGVASLSASSTLGAFAQLIQKTNASLVATSTIAAQANLVGNGVSSLVGECTLNADAIVFIEAEASLIAASSMLPNGKAVLKGVSNMAASSAFVADVRLIRGAKVASGFLEFDRITEEDDNRITEDGKIRVTNPIETNIIAGSMVANANLIPFTSTAYINVGGVWKEVMDIDVNRLGNWSNLDKVYRNMSGEWKRIY